MAYASFRQFIDALDRAGELTRVSVPVETDLVISEWANREMKSPDGGKALLFEQPTIDGRPSQFPVAINTMGSGRRMAMALKLRAAGHLDHVLVGDDGAWGVGTSQPLPTGAESFNNLMDAAPPPAEWPEIAPDEIALIQYAMNLTLEVQKRAHALLKPGILASDVVRYIDQQHRDAHNRSEREC